MPSCRFIMHITQVIRGLRYSFVFAMDLVASRICAAAGIQRHGNFSLFVGFFKDYIPRCRPSLLTSFLDSGVDTGQPWMAVLHLVVHECPVFRSLLNYINSFLFFLTVSGFEFLALNYTLTISLSPIVPQRKYSEVPYKAIVRCHDVSLS